VRPLSPPVGRNKKKKDEKKLSGGRTGAQFSSPKREKKKERLGDPHRRKESWALLPNWERGGRAGWKLEPRTIKGGQLLIPGLREEKNSWAPAVKRGRKHIKRERARWGGGPALPVNQQAQKGKRGRPPRSVEKFPPTKVRKGVLFSLKGHLAPPKDKEPSHLQVPGTVEVALLPRWTGKKKKASPPRNV